LPADDERPRSRGIGGSVLEKDGAPVAGLAVGLRARRVFSGSPASALRTTTDGRGNFAFGAVADGEYEIRSEKNDRYQSASALVRAGTDSAVLVVEPISENLVSIHGVVESIGGAPLEGVRITAIGASITAVTDAKGAYALRLPAGARVEQTSLQFRRAGYRDRRWVITEGLRSSDYDVIGNVRLEPDATGLSVSGVVTSSSGTPVARAQVQLDSTARGRGYRGLTDVAGRFTLANVEAGSDYRLWVRPQSGFRDGVLENVLVDAAMQPLDVEVVPIGVATLRGRMVTPDGANIPGFTMWLTSAYGNGPRSLPVTSDAQGRFVAADLPEGPVALQTRAAPALSVSGINLSTGTPAASDITVTVDVGPHRLDGLLLTSEGAPAAGLRVSLEWSASSGGVMSRSSRETTTNSDGSFMFTQLGGGVHTVSATLAGAGGVRVDHRVGAGNQPIQIALPGKRGSQ
jgi:5-hydroxyisourate hydrolase-like protein (transthyretin family)